MKTIEDVTHFLENDQELMQLLRDAASLGLPDWWICAGYVRGKIWDTLHGYSNPTPTEDIDVIYFDPSQPDEAVEKRHEATLHALSPNIAWSVKNQARMHLVNQLSPFESAVDALGNFTETATAIGVSLDAKGRLIVAAPHGVDDLVGLKLRPTPAFQEGSSHHQIYCARISKKIGKPSGRCFNQSTVALDRNRPRLVGFFVARLERSPQKSDHRSDHFEYIRFY